MHIELTEKSSILMTKIAIKLIFVIISKKSESLKDIVH